MPKVEAEEQHDVAPAPLGKLGRRAAWLRCSRPPHPSTRGFIACRFLLAGEVFREAWMGELALASRDAEAVSLEIVPTRSRFSHTHGWVRTGPRSQNPGVL